MPFPTPPPAEARDAAPLVAERVADVSEAPAPPDDEGAPAFDPAMESAFLAEARDRGEPVVATVAPEPEEADPKALPPLDSLVQRIPPEVRDMLDELFRARFVRVQKVPKKALSKGS